MAGDAGWPSWAFENHDAPRAISRWVGDRASRPFARTKNAVARTLRGTIILYQGEELGLPQVDIPFDRLQDPEAIANWPQTLSATARARRCRGTRTQGSLAFRTGEPWLPMGAEHSALAIDRQEADAILRYSSRETA